MAILTGWFDADELALLKAGSLHQNPVVLHRHVVALGPGTHHDPLQPLYYVSTTTSYNHCIVLWAWNTPRPVTTSCIMGLEYTSTRYNQLYCTGPETQHDLLQPFYYIRAQNTSQPMTTIALNWASKYTTTHDNHCVELGLKIHHSP